MAKNAKKKPVAKKKPAAKKKPVKASAKPVAKAKVKAAPATKAKGPRKAVSWKLFLVMTIVGGVLLSAASTTLSLCLQTYTQEVHPDLLPPEMQTLALVFLILTIVFGVVGIGLLGPGIPLMIVNIIKNRKAQPKVKASAKPAVKATVKAKAKPKAKKKK